MKTLRVEFCLPDRELGGILDLYIDFRSDVPTKEECIGFIKLHLYRHGITGLSDSCSGEALKYIKKYKLWT